MTHSRASTAGPPRGGAAHGDDGGARIRRLSPELSFTHVHVLAPLCAISLLLSVFSVTRELNLFAFHPICMTFGVVLLMTEGLTVYKNGVVTLVTDLMTGKRKDKQRSIHTVLQVRPPAFFRSTRNRLDRAVPAAPAPIDPRSGTRS